MKFKRISFDATRDGPHGRYQSVDGRFVIHWEDRQGARSTWTVTDTTGVLRSLRADSFAEAKDTAEEMAARGDQ